MKKSFEFTLEEVTKILLDKLVADGDAPELDGKFVNRTAMVTPEKKFYIIIDGVYDTPQLP